MVAQLKTTRSDLPEVGKDFSSFTLENIKYYPRRSAKVEDFKGKWLVIDVWDKNCTACIASLPKMNALQNEFEQSIQIMMVAPADTENELIFEKFKSRLGLVIPSAFEKGIEKRLDAAGLPFIIVIDPSGFVRGITTKITSENLKVFLSGSIPLLADASRQSPKSKMIEESNPGKTSIDGASITETSILLQSTLSRTKLKMSGAPAELRLDEHAKFEVVSVDLSTLYMYAFLGIYPYWGTRDSLYGNFWPKPIIATRDSSNFQFDRTSMDNLFRYSMACDLKAFFSKNRLMKIMQNDLHNYFQYTVKIESRELPYWKLVASEKAKINLKTKGGAFYSSPGKVAAGVTLKNCPMEIFTGAISGFTQDQPMPIIDETGIRNNIDIKLDCVMTDLDDLRRCLKAKGLDLIRGEKTMKVLVIRDPESESTK